MKSTDIIDACRFELWKAIPAKRQPEAIKRPEDIKGEHTFEQIGAGTYEVVKALMAIERRLSFRSKMTGANTVKEFVSGVVTDLRAQGRVEDAPEAMALEIA